MFLTNRTLVWQAFPHRTTGMLSMSSVCVCVCACSCACACACSRACVSVCVSWLIPCLLRAANTCMHVAAPAAAGFVDEKQNDFSYEITKNNSAGLSSRREERLNQSCSAFPCLDVYYCRSLPICLEGAPCAATGPPAVYGVNTCAAISFLCCTFPVSVGSTL